MSRPPPRFLFLQTNQRCNLKCTHCSYWLNNDDDRSRYLTTAERFDYLRAFAAMGGESMVTCGGEPMLDLEDYFALTRGAREAGLGCLSVVNGTRVTAATALRMVREGPSEITISLDHWIPKENDRLRGVAGAFVSASNAVRHLVAARARLDSSVKIHVMTILSEDTWPTLEHFYRYVLTDLGADKLKLNVLQPTFQGRSIVDEYFAGARVTDVDACMKSIRAADALFQIARNPEWLADVEMYLRSVRNPLLGWSGTTTTRDICNSYDRNIMLDLYGGARLCFSTNFPSVQLAGAHELAAFWNRDSLPLRACMLGCKAPCGISHSVRRSESTLKKEATQ